MAKQWNPESQTEYRVGSYRLTIPQNFKGVALAKALIGFCQHLPFPTPPSALAA